MRLDGCFVDSGAIGESGTARPSFNQKGVIYVTQKEDKTLSRDEALEKAIEAGAEDVIDSYDDEDRPALKVTLSYLLMSGSYLKVNGHGWG